MTISSRDRSAISRFLVGNDVVDLIHPRCREMPLDGRFVDRVFTVGERSHILEAREPLRSLWLTWAAKEAAYKVVSKRLGSAPPFVHAAFRVTIDDEDGGEVAWEGFRVAFRDEAPGSAEYVHVVAWSPDRPHTLAPGMQELPLASPPSNRLSERERAAVHSPASAWVRIAARQRAAALLGRRESELEIVCGEGPPGRTAPELHLEGRTSHWDVSLSHHGRWIAWTLGRGSDPAWAYDEER